MIKVFKFFDIDETITSHGGMMKQKVQKEQKKTLCFRFCKQKYVCKIYELQMLDLSQKSGTMIVFVASDMLNVDLPQTHDDSLILSKSM